MTQEQPPNDDGKPADHGADAPPDQAQTPEPSGFEEFDLDDIEVIESKVFA